MLRIIGRLVSARSGLGATVQTLGTNLAALAINLCTGVLTARLLGPAGRGELAAIVMWPQFIAFLCTFGLPPALLYNVRGGTGRDRELVSATLLYTTAAGMLAASIGALFLPYWLSTYPAEVVTFARWAMIAAPFPLFVVTFTALLQARGEFVIYNTVIISQPAMFLAGLGIIWLSGALTPFSAAVANLIPAVLVAILLLARFWTVYRPVFRGVAWATRRLFSYGLRSYVAEVLGTLANQIDRVMVIGLLEPALVGLYVVALSLSQTLNVFANAVIVILFPRSAGKTAAEAVALTGRAARVHFPVALLAAAVAAVIGPVALKIVYGANYLGAVAVFRILLVETVLRGSFLILSQAMMAVGRPGLVGVAQAVGLLVTIVMINLLVPVLGLEGAGIAILCSTLLRVATMLFMYPLALGQRLPRLWMNVADLGELLSAIGAKGRR